MPQNLIELIALMVKRRAIRSDSIKKAFLSVPREKFFNDKYVEFAFEDSAFPLEGTVPGEMQLLDSYKKFGHVLMPPSVRGGSTISQPSTIAAMLEMLDLKEGQKVLEIGSGSGYVLALIYQITNSPVFGIEINAQLAEKSRKVLLELNVKAQVISADGKEGLAREAPFDRILVSAALPNVPDALVSQLKKGGRLVAPVGLNSQSLVLFGSNGKVLEEKKGYVFVKLQ